MLECTWTHHHWFCCGQRQSLAAAEGGRLERMVSWMQSAFSVSSAICIRTSIFSKFVSYDRGADVRPVCAIWCRDVSNVASVDVAISWVRVSDFQNWEILGMPSVSLNNLSILSLFGVLNFFNDSSSLLLAMFRKWLSPSDISIWQKPNSASFSMNTCQKAISWRI